MLDRENETNCKEILDYGMLVFAFLNLCVESKEIISKSREAISDFGYQFVQVI